MKSVLLSLVLLSSLVWSGRLVRVYDITSADAYYLLTEGYDVANYDAHRRFADVMVEHESFERLVAYKSHYEILPEEWSCLLSENSWNAGYYYSPEENWAFWCGLADEYSDLVDTPVTIGQSYEGRDIYSIRLSSSSGPPVKTPVYFSSLIHGREPGSNSVLIDFAMWLTTNYSSDTMAEFILDNTEVYFVPVANPDAYVYNMPGGGMQRKNMNWDTPVSSSGIDLNRNWGYQWGYDDVGSSPNPYSETYRGHEAFSEVETQVQRDFIGSIIPIAAMNYHTYGGMLIYPYGYSGSAVNPDSQTFMEWANAMTEFNLYEYGTAPDILYRVNGEQNDWCYHDYNILAFTPEVDDNGFWGGQNDTTLIETFCAECRYMNIWLCMNAPAYVGIGEGEPLVFNSALQIASVYPNPVSAATSVTLLTAGGSNVRIDLFDLSGRVVSTLFDGEVEAGETVFSLVIPESVPPGIYLLRGTSGSDFDEARITVLK